MKPVSNETRARTIKLVDGDDVRRRLSRVVFTGRLATLARRDAEDVVRERGGEVTGGVSRRTSMLVVGEGGWPLLADGSVSRKLQRAEQLRAAGAALEIVPEAVFLEVTGLSTKRAAVRKQYEMDQVAAIVGVPVATLARWEAQGLIRSSEGRCDFQDIIALRTIAELLQRGVTSADIATSVRGLAGVLPDVDHPLAQLKLVEQSGTLLAELGEMLVAPDGQFVLNFDADDAAPAPNLALPTAEETRSAEDWLEEGAALEDEDALDEAVAAYRRALAMRTPFPEAHFNLGNALRELGRLEAAGEQFEMAVTQAAGMEIAWYNLADVQEEQGRVDEAADSLRRALHACPEFADAHYNLASLLEEEGERVAARDHWRAYLRLDAVGPWADHARQRLAVLTRDA